MRPADINLASQIDSRLGLYPHPLPGIANLPEKHCLIEQIVESVRRVKYVQHLSNSNRPLDAARTNPNSPLYHPIKAAIIFRNNQQFDEACWQIFLSVHFGRNKYTKWHAASELYGALGQGYLWDWASVSSNPQSLITWLNNNQGKFVGKFGNHRKYQSWSATSRAGTGEAINTYVKWVTQYGGHKALLNNFQTKYGQNPHTLFQSMSNSMTSVLSFGRVGKFDFLTMMAKTDLFQILPDSCYIKGSTGPKIGGELLFGARRSIHTEVDNLMNHLQPLLGGFTGQILEDALCNWQKSPAVFIPFRD